MVPIEHLPGFELGWSRGLSPMRTAIRCQLQRPVALYTPVRPESLHSHLHPTCTFLGILPLV